MKSFKAIDGITTEDGKELLLTCRDGDYQICLDGQELMTSHAHRSEGFLASLACAELAGLAAPRVLVGGLGLGYTLRSALDHLPPEAVVVVAEVFPAVVEWNRGPLAPLAGHPLEDRRVSVLENDVTDVLTSQAAFDAILLDVDNGPEGLTRDSNEWLYQPRGLSAARRALRPGGVLAIWSSASHPWFSGRIRGSGFEVSEERVRARRTKGARRTIWVAKRREG